LDLYDKFFSEGKAQGKAEAKTEVAINLLKFGMGCEQVVEMTGLALYQIQKLAEEVAMMDVNMGDE
jgi:hypothetical protein